MTRDIAVFPTGASDDEFLWRASLAAIAAAGPFSAWPGVDRSFMLLDGELVLSIDGADRRVMAGEPAIHFAGEAAVSAAPIGAACTALNLMARRGQVRAKLDRWDTPRSTAADQLMLLAEVATSVRLDRASLSLEPHDALMLDRRELATLDFDQPAVVAELLA